LAGCCGHGTEPSVTVKCGGFLEELRNCQLVNKGSAPLRSALAVDGYQSSGQNPICNVRVRCT